MTALALSLLVDRTELGLTALELQQAGVYEVVSVRPGPVTRRRQTETSLYVEGDIETNSVKAATTATAVVRVLGASAAELDIRTAVLLAAFDQSSYLLDFTVDGVTYRWRCRAADYGVASDDFDPNLLRRQRQAYRFLIPRQPTPLLGTI